MLESLSDPWSYTILSLIKLTSFTIFHLKLVPVIYYMAGHMTLF